MQQKTIDFSHKKHRIKSIIFVRNDNLLIGFIKNSSKNRI